MPSEERNTIVAVLSHLVILSFYVIYLNRIAAQGLLLGPDAVVHWARAVVTMMLSGIGFTIVVMGVVAIAASVIAGAQEGGGLVDERDRMIRGWGMRVTMVASSVGFLIGVGALALGEQALDAGEERPPQPGLRVEEVDLALHGVTAGGDRASVERAEPGMAGGERRGHAACIGGDAGSIGMREGKAVDPDAGLGGERHGRHLAFQAASGQVCHEITGFARHRRVIHRKACHEFA